MLACFVFSFFQSITILRDFSDNMEGSGSILRKVWEGAIPVCFRLSSDEVPPEAPSPPPPFFVSPHFVMNITLN